MPRLIAATAVSSSITIASMRNSSVPTTPLKPRSTLAAIGVGTAPTIIIAVTPAAGPARFAIWNAPMIAPPTPTNATARWATSACSRPRAAAPPRRNGAIRTVAPATQSAIVRRPPSTSSAAVDNVGAVKAAANDRTPIGDRLRHCRSPATLTAIMVVDVRRRHGVAKSGVGMRRL